MDASSVAQWISAVLFVGAAAAVVVSKFWTKPTEEKVVEANVADATLKLASGTITLVTERMHKEFERLNKELDEQRREFAEARAQHAKEMRIEHEAKVALRKEVDEALAEMHKLRISIRQAQAEADKWREKYHRVAGPETAGQ